MAESTEKRMNKFLWSGEAEVNNSHLLKRSWTSKLKLDGVLEIGNTVTKNKTLLCKLLWRYSMEQEP